MSVFIYVKYFILNFKDSFTVALLILLCLFPYIGCACRNALSVI